MNTNDSIRDAYIIRGILLEQLKSSHATKIKREYKKILDDILTRLNSHNEVGLTNMNKIIKEIKQAVAPEITLLSDLQGTAESEAVYVQSAINASAGVEIAKRLPKDSTLLRIVNADLFEGNTVMETFTMFDAKLRHDLQGEIRQSVVQGETISQIKQRITNRFGLVGKQAETIARTATHSLVNKVRDEVYKENEDIFKGYKSIAVLDSRTTLVCASMDNLQWDLEYKPIGHSKTWIPIPRHPNCRSIKLPITKSYRELGFDMDEVDGLTRSSLDGAVPQKMNFNDWLKTKDPEFIKDKLGLGKAKLFMEGKITIGDLVTKNGRELTLAELNGLSKSAKVVVPKVIQPSIILSPTKKLSKTQLESITTMDDLEEITKNNNTEHAGIFKADGTKVFAKSGGKGSVSFNGVESLYMNDNIMTHNHPKGGSFSPEDIYTAVVTNLREIRAVDSKYVHRLIRPDDGWNSKVSVPNSFLKNARAKMRSASYDFADKGFAEVTHNTIKEIAESYGLTYIRELK